MKKSYRKLLPFPFLLLATALLGTILADPLFAAPKLFRNSLGMEFVLIPAGTFRMGSPPGEPHRGYSELKHQVTVSRPFYMQSTEITLQQWRAVMGKRFFFRKKGSPHMPVVKVSWHDCMDFIEKLNSRHPGTYRLPTEAEWEYACRAGTASAYSWGDEIDCSKAMYENNSLKHPKCLEYIKSRGLSSDQPATVKSYAPNAWGLYEMHGNVWEWCADWFGEYPAEAATDPRGPPAGSQKIRRGGSWYGYWFSCRSANRNPSHPASRYRTTGFRLVLDKLPTAEEKPKPTEKRPPLYLDEMQADGP